MEDYYTIQTPGHHNSVFSELHTLQKQGVLCDVILAAEDGEVMAHKVVLMAASKYFRDKLSPTVSANPSRICLKGISVVELANLVKYIYTGKLLVAKETMDVTLEVSEILELKGVTQGYNDIVAYEQMKSDGSVVPSTSNAGAPQGETVVPSTVTSDSSNNPNTTGDQAPCIVASWSITPPAQDSTTAVSSSTDEAVTAVTASSVELETTAQSQVTDGKTESRIEANLVAPAEHGVATSTLPTTEYSFEFNPYDQQYMDVSVGANTQVTSASHIPRQIQMAKPAQIVTDEQAQHQDLLAVAIETLSDPSHFVAGIHKPFTGSEANVTIEAVASPNQSTIESNVDAAGDASLDFQNGKIESKIVTLSAGTVTNELGGQTSVYTVALDPSSIKSPLLMPRVLRKKSEKEKQAEMVAKMYRKKKAELLHRQTIVTPVNPTETEIKHALLTKLPSDSSESQLEATDKSGKTKRTPRILLRSSKSKDAESLLQDTVQHILIHRLQDGSVTTTKVIDHQKEKPPQSDGGEEVEHAVVQNKEEFGQMVNFDSENEDDTAAAKIAEAPTEDEKDAKKVGNTNNDNAKAQLETNNSVKSKVEQVSETKPFSVMVTRGQSRKEHDKDKITEQLEGTENENKCIELPVDHNDKVSTDISPKSQDKLKVMDENVADNTSDKSEDHSCSPDNTDSQVPDRVRSSATKRKGKEPRRLDHDNVNARKKNILIPIVRTRRSSRNDNAPPTTRTTRAKSVNKNDKEAVDNIADKTTDLDDNGEEQTVTPTIEIESVQENFKILESVVGKGKNPINTENTAADGKKPESNTTKSKQGLKGGSVGSRETSVVITDIIDDSDDQLANAESDDDDDDIEDIDLDMTVEEIQAIHKGPDIRKAHTKSGSQIRKRRRTTSRSSNRSESVESSDDCSSQVDLTHCCQYCAFRAGSMACIEKHEKFFHEMVVMTTRSSPGVKKKMKMDPESDMVQPVCVCKVCAAIQRRKKPVTGPVKCRECQKEFSAEYDLHVHLFKAHGQEQPKVASSYSCPVCGLVEAAYSLIDLHMQTHEGNHIECLKCEKMYMTYSELKKHQISHSEKRFKCHYCDFTANVVATVKMHIKLKHSKVKELVECQFCDYSTPLPGNMRKHMLTVHGLQIVTKQSLGNRQKYKGFQEGQLVTKDLKLFDPETMKVPKGSSRKRSHNNESKGNQQEVDMDTEEGARGKKGRKPALHKLPTEEFEKEILKRHQEYLKKPEKRINFMSHILATATGHPSFPQASPNVRQTKADKVYHSVRPNYRLQELSSEAESQIYVTEGVSNLPTVGKEIEVIHNDSPVTIVTENVADDDLQTIYDPNVSVNEQQLIVVTKDGKETLMQTKDFYEALVEKESSMETKETIGDINALLAAGQEVQIQEKDGKSVEIQNV